MHFVTGKLITFCVILLYFWIILWCWRYAVLWLCLGCLFFVPTQPPRNRPQRVPPRSRQPQDSQQKSQIAQQCVTGRQGWEWQRKSSRRSWGGCRGTGWLNVWSEHQPWKATTFTLKFGQHVTHDRITELLYLPCIRICSNPTLIHPKIYMP